MDFESYFSPSYAEVIYFNIYLLFSLNYISGTSFHTDSWRTFYFLKLLRDIILRECAIVFVCLFVFNITSLQKGLKVNMCAKTWAGEEVSHVAIWGKVIESEETAGAKGPWPEQAWLAYLRNCQGQRGWRGEVRALTVRHYKHICFYSKWDGETLLGFWAEKTWLTFRKAHSGFSVENRH